MSTFTANDLDRSIGKVYKAAVEAAINGGAITINHDKYPTGIFVMEFRPRHPLPKNSVMLGKELIDGEWVTTVDGVPLQPGQLDKILNG